MTVGDKLLKLFTGKNLAEHRLSKHFGSVENCKIDIPEAEKPVKYYVFAPVEVTDILKVNADCTAHIVKRAFCTDTTMVVARDDLSLKKKTKLAKSLYLIAVEVKDINHPWSMDSMGYTSAKKTREYITKYFADVYNKSPEPELEHKFTAEEAEERDAQPEPTVSDVEHKGPAGVGVDDPEKNRAQ